MVDYVWFVDDGKAEGRKILYKLESQGIVRCASEKIKLKPEDKLYGYSYNWELTKKGTEIVSKNVALQELWQIGNIQEFYKIFITLGD